MAHDYLVFNPITWEDRVSAYPNRRKLTEVGETTSVSYTIERDDDPVTNEGTPFNASTMTALQNQIADITIRTVGTYNNNDGLMTYADKQKLDSISSGATRNVISSGTSAPSGGNSGDIYLRYS